MLTLGAVGLWPENAVAQARSLAGGVGGFKAGGSSSSAATSQSATAATAATAQQAAAVANASRAQISLAASVAAFQKAAQQQMAAQTAAMQSAANNLGTAAAPINGLAIGGLNPVGGIPAVTASTIQLVDLSGSGKNQLVLSNGGTVALPSGTSGTDEVSVTGSGSVTSTSGTVSASAGSLSTSTGGTLAATNGGTISLMAGSATLSTTTGATIKSSVAGSYTSGGSTVSFAANQQVAVPAGATVSFKGSTAATVGVMGAATVKLSGAGTLALSGAASGTGGTIITNSGTTQFTNATITSEPAGTQITLAGSGSIAFDGSGSDVLPVILEAQPTVNPTTSQTTYAPPSFTTTGSVLQTTGYNVPSTWTLGAGGSLTQSFDSSTQQTVDTIVQTKSEALLYWQTFNIGKNTTLDFDQSAGGADVGDWVAINRILDPTINPTQILGAIEAPGQVYVINQNGIIFGGSAQVDTHALVASTLPINTNLVTDGFLNNPDGQFLFSSEEIPTQGNTPTYDPNNDVSKIVTSTGTITQANTKPNFASGGIVVEQGASLLSPGSAEGVGGKIALIAPTIDNEGEITSPDGQVILAAGQQVGFTAHPSADPSLRGLDVAIGAADNGTALAAGNPALDTVTNGQNGLIYAPEGDVTVTAPSIVQNGIIESTTSVALNGRIDLLAMSGLTYSNSAQSFVATQGDGTSSGGTITLGQGSLTEILPDYSSTDTEVGTSLALPSQIYVEGASFQMLSNAEIIAPNATTTFGIGILNTPIVATSGATSNPLAEDVGAESGLGQSTTLASPATPADYLTLANPSQVGQVTMADGSLIDVSGSSDVEASVLENIISVQLTAAVLENSPLQRDGTLHGDTVTVDITQTGTNADGSTWVGSPIGDLSGYANLIEHNVGELTINGGSVNINTNGSVNLEAGSTINVSGGSIAYQGADVQTTNLVASDGQIVNISQANPDTVYNGIYTGSTSSSAKWGVSQTISPSLGVNETFDPGYVQGGNGGSLTINAPSMTLGGSLYGNTTQGARQQSSPPTASKLNLNIAVSTPGVNPPVVNFVIQAATDAASADPSTVSLSSDLFGVDGFSNATIDTGSGNITVASDAVIAAVPGGSLNFTAANVYIKGQIDVPSGSVSITALPKDPLDTTQGNPTTYNPAIGNVEVYTGASINTTGLIFDELSGTAPGTLPFSVNGGSISISSAVTKIDAGSSIDASGGLARSATGVIHDGNGGNISIAASFNGLEGNADGQLVLDGSLSAYGIGQGGSLSLTAPAVIVDNGSSTTAQVFPANATPLTLNQDFFSQGGFSNISLVGSAGVQILGGTTIAPVLTEEVADTVSGQFGVSLVSSAQLPAFPAAPVNLSFSAPGSSGNYIATLSLDANASIVTAPTANVKLSGELVDIEGNVTAPGGNITITGGSTSSLGLAGQAGIFVPPVVTVHLGSDATLSVTGEELTTPTEYGNQVFNTGEVLNGGTISITGNIVGDAGASLQANGAAGTLDVPYSTTSASLNTFSLQQLANPYVSQAIASNGGSISINGIEEAYFAGSVSAKAGSIGHTTGIGGTLTFGSGLAATYTPPPNAGYPEVFIQQSGTFATGPVTLGQALTGASSQTGGGFFTVEQFNDGGFGSLILKGNVEFENGSTNPITINASQEVEILPDSLNGTVFADGSAEAITINAPYIEIGATTLTINQQSVSNDAPTFVANSSDNVQATPTLGLADPTFGAATLTLNATDLIDVGFLSLQNFGTANLVVPTGDIRGGGLFYAAGTINMTAGQIYTPTAATFTAAAFGSDNTVNGGTINILPGVDRPLPLSAGGTINIFATNILQDGNLEAPFGVINLGALPDASTGETPVLAGVTISQNANTDLFDITSADVSQFAPVTLNLTLGQGSITSVSGVSGSQVLDVPFGTIENGTEWIAPNGQDITAGGLPAKAINLMGNNVNDMSGAVINLTGGGDLFAYAFNPGVGGTNDILSIDKFSNGQIVVTSANIPVLSTSFAIVPTYGLNYAPVDLTIDSTGAFPFAAAPGSLSTEIGEDIYLAGGDGISAGTYTILPARYALLPGAYLVSPESTRPSQTSQNPDGSINMAGYVYNGLNPNQNIVPTITGFELSSNAVVNNAAPFTTSSANTFLSASATANNQAVPRLPQDAGQLVFDASAGLDIEGTLDGQSVAGGLGSIVDISSSDDIYIVSTPGEAPTVANSGSGGVFLTLSAQELNNFGADSLLIGGTRTTTSGGTSIDVTTDNIYVENTTTALEGNEIILAANDNIELTSGASIQQSGQVSTGQENLSIGNASVAGSGDGVLLRVTGDPNATFTRLGVNTADTTPNLTIGAGASISGVAVTLDSTSGVTIDPSAQLDQGVKGKALTLSSGTISLQVDPNVSVASAPGLVLGSTALQSLETSVDSLSLSSYSSINLYGAGTIGAPGANITLQGAGIFGLDNGGGAVVINAQSVTLANPNNVALSGSVPGLSGGGTFTINANTINFGVNTIAIDGFTNVQLNASNGMLVSGTGALNAQGSLGLGATEITGATGANYTFNAQGGTLAVTEPTTTGTVTVSGGLGASISFNGSSVTLGSTVFAPSGTITATASTGNVEVQATGTLDVSGQEITFGSAIADTSAGTVNLTSQNGNVLVDSGALVNVSAKSGGGNAGTVNVSAPNGTASIASTVTSTGTMSTVSGSAGANGSGGTFNAKLGQAPTLSGLATPIVQGGFQTMNFDVLTGSTTVDGAIGAALGTNGATSFNGITSFTLTTEAGGITVDNSINASGVTGGTIDLYSDTGVTLTGNAVLSVAGEQLDDAGKGGTIDIETLGGTTSSGNIGAIDIQQGAQLYLGIGSGTPVAAGTLHLRAPLLTDVLGAGDSAVLPVVTNAAGNDAVAGGIAIDSIIASAINDAGSVVIEGYRVYEPANGSIDSIDGANGPIAQDVASFPTATIASQLGVTGNSLFQIQPGIEIINPNTGVNSGNLTLTSNWDLSSLRTTAGLPGILTIRAAGSLLFTASLTDGFAYNPTADDTANGEENPNSPYTWDLMPVGSESWSYRLVAGAQFNGNASPANFGEVVAQAEAPTGSLDGGSLQLGVNIPTTFNFGTQTSTAANQFAQLIRTGTGDITIDVGGSVYLLNQMSTIYTAGQLAPSIAGFSSPTGDDDTKIETKVYGTPIAPAAQYTAQYTENGGSIAINAGQDIEHLTKNASGQYVLDTSWQFPTNWLYRRGATSSTDVFDTTKLNASEVATTTWWVDFSNFFEGIGALGGGNVSLNAGNNIINVDAVVPTNARMPGNVPDQASSLVQLGGGDLSVIAGGTIAGGTYYVEQGNALIQANTISTTAANDSARISAEDKSMGSTTPLPLTLFLGSGTITVDATNDVTLGSTVNPFLLPQGIGNSFNDESIFSTYGVASTVDVNSLLGSIYIQGSEIDGGSLAGSLANAYLSNASPGQLHASTFTKEKSLTGTPWTLTLDPSGIGTGSIDNVTDYSSFYNFSPPIFGATAFTGNIQYKSDQTLAPSVDGTMRLLAGGAIEGAFDNSSIGDGLTATIEILDDDPAQLPSVTNPIGFGTTTVNALNDPSIGKSIANIDGLISEAPSFEDDSFATLQSEHTSGLLHTNPATPPVEIATINGDIEDFTLMSAEKVDVSSGLDLEDVSLYIQNNNADDISIVSANRNITLFDPNSSGLLAINAANSPSATFGDIQVAGPGTLEVLAGGNLNLGEGASPNALLNPGTNLGITTIGNARDPFLPFGGAQIIAAAGLGTTSGLNSTPLADYQGFINDYLDPSAAPSSVYLPDLGAVLGLSSATDAQIWDVFSGTTTPDVVLTTPEQQLQTSMTPEARDALATTIFYDVLRDAGRDHNNPASTGFGNYNAGFAAISTLFPATGSYTGDISLTSREFKTTNGGDIDLLAPGGGIEVGLNNLGAQAVDQGILTVDGGNISIFTDGNVDVGTSRIFTLHGGNVIIWSSAGDIDAGAASRTVQSAPPTRVEVDSQSANVQTDLAGLATGGGIGVLETVVGAPPGDVDLIAPVGTVNAGDAGIRASGNVNVAAAQVLNAGNIQAGGSKTGTGSTATPNIAAAVSASNAAGSSQNAASAAANQQQPNSTAGQDLPSIITVQVVGFGGDDSDSASTEKPPDRKSSSATYLADHSTDANAAKF